MHARERLTTLGKFGPCPSLLRFARRIRNPLGARKFEHLFTVEKAASIRRGGSKHFSIGRMAKAHETVHWPNLAGHRSLRNALDGSAVCRIRGIVQDRDDNALAMMVKLLVALQWLRRPCTKHVMKTTARLALWPILERARKAVTPEMQDRLRDKLAQLGRLRVELMLQIWRPLALELAQAKTVRVRRDLLGTRAANDPEFALYATAAWIVRTLVLMEYLEGFDPHLPQQWASSQALSLIDNFDGDEAWLWPFDSVSPWPEEDS